MESLENLQVELFFEQLNAIAKQEDKLHDHFNIARNLACSEWEVSAIPSVAGGRYGLQTVRMLPDQMKLLHTNCNKLREELSYRKYALIKAYQHVIKDRLTGDLLEVLKYWEKK